ncbi:hypothetical protein CAPTEDRAFT_189438 [Capitella teleta]|uniref:G-protein coupled receptors family 1 profile domain-containing protein n=1 Tax=Capitella teleta TaxID=283909 RepID=R7VAD3_CAPTE|nr:hypothetical protein CAPTEDRAFT_189438 [Capitella teleta]|eukprot:ELU15574.1 hypothetical protein CAPTEDRAFT_189438 [Capitella teleta]
MPSLSHSLLSDAKSNHDVCTTLGFLHSVLSKASQLSVALIAFDRYHSITHCLHFHNNITHPIYVVKGLSFVWGQAVVLTTFAMFIADSSNTIDDSCCMLTEPRNALYDWLMFGVCFWETVVIIVYCYVKIIGIARYHKRQIENIRHTSSNSSSAQPQSGVDPNGALALAMVHPIQRLTFGPQLLSTQSRQLRQFLKGQSTSYSTDASGSQFSYPASGSQIRKTTRASAKLIGLIIVFIAFWLPVQVNTICGAKRRTWTAMTVGWSLLTSVMHPYLYVIGSKRYQLHISRVRAKLSQVSNEEQKRKRYHQAVARLAALYRSSEQGGVSPVSPNSPGVQAMPRVDAD